MALALLGAGAATRVVLLSLGAEAGVATLVALVVALDEPAN